MRCLQNSVLIMFDPAEQVFFLVSWIFTIKFLQVSVASAIRPIYSAYSPAIAYPLSILIFTICTLYAVSLSLPFWVALIPFITILGYRLITHDIRMTAIREDLVYDVVFGIFFLFALEFRYLNPVISNFSEQFMDHAFIASIMRMPVVPPLDPWFAGGDLSMYYYGGHWVFAMISLLSHVPSVVSFNFILPTVFGLSAVCLFMIGRMYLKRFIWMPLVTLVLIHPAILWYILTGSGIWVALNNTRWIITGCITEYPLFSLLLGDAHSHVLDLFNQFFLLSMILCMISCPEKTDAKKILAGTVITGISLGFMVVCNSWDVIVYAPLVVSAGIYVAWQSRGKPLWFRLFFMLATPALAFIFWLPSIITMSTGSCTGIRFITQGIDPVQILLYAGVFIGFTLLVFREEIRKYPYILVIPVLFLASGYPSTAIISMPFLCLVSRLLSSYHNIKSVFPILLGISGFSILCFFTVFQVSLDSDATPMNTVFKLGYAAWMMLMVSLLLIAGHLLSGLNLPDAPLFKKCMIILCIVCLLTAPFAARINLARDLVGLSYTGGYQTFDGSSCLWYDHEEDYEAFRYAQSLPENSVILEGVGGDYSYSAPISSFSGVPTVLGKFSHEFQWRGSRYGWMPERSEDIKTMYEYPNLSIPLLKKYQVTHLYVGDTEEDQYNVSLPLGNLEPVWSGQKSILYRVTESDKRLYGTWQ